MFLLCLHAFSSALAAVFASPLPPHRHPHPLLPQTSSLTEPCLNPCRGSWGDLKIRSFFCAVGGSMKAFINVKAREAEEEEEQRF
ncbi:hypothetical protein MUK42_33129 [Musa troglodytarum]|uniref:Secreted protein n=1 Tax=Musa troglodytarum TaxID=320322 RepID=A0A9E7EX86_9LILI|nr:hypothetical protein MUK42_33129 [Musa troglodytarum]